MSLLNEVVSLTSIETDIQKVRYSHSKGHGAPIEVIRLSELRERELTMDISAPTRQDFYQLEFVTAGTGAHWVDFIRHPLTVGDVLQVRPDQVHAFDARSNHEALILLFRPEIVSSDLIGRLSVQLCEPFHLDAQELDFFVQLLDLLLKMAEVPEPLRLTSMAPGLLQAVISGLDDLYASGKDEVQSPSRHRALELIFRFEQLLQQETVRRPLSDFSKALHVTEKTLARACHEVRGLSPKKLIDQYCTLEAKRKLILGDDTVENIAFELGFSEATNFVKYFKRIAGQTPEAFRSDQRHLSA